MKTLDEVEPRIPIFTIPGSEDWLYVIDQPGHYYLTGDIVGEPGKGGILINQPDGPVSIHGMGFRLIGVAGTTVAIDGVEGESTDSTHAGKIDVEELHISGWDAGGIRAPELVVRLRDVTVVDSGGPGVVAGNHSRLTNVVVEGCKSGIEVGDYSRLSATSALNNDGDGIAVGDGATLRGGVAIGNTGNGAIGPSMVSIVDLMSNSNAGTGILAGAGSNILESMACNNGGDGIAVTEGTLVKANSSRYNVGAQLAAFGDGNVLSCNRLATGPNTTSATAMRITGRSNIVEMNGLIVTIPQSRGILVQGDGNLVEENAINITEAAIGAVGIHSDVGSARIRGGSITVAAQDAMGIRGDATSRLNIIAILIGLSQPASNATGVQLAGSGSSVQWSRINAVGPNTVAIRDLGSLSILPMNGLVLSGGGAMGIVTGFGANGGRYTNNQITLLESAQVGISLTVGQGFSVSGNAIRMSSNVGRGIHVTAPRSSVANNDISILEGFNSEGIRIGGSAISSHVADNVVRSTEGSATGVTVAPFSNALILRNTAVGQGTWYDIGGNTQPAVIVENPGTGFSVPGGANLAIGP